jgi:ribosome-binding protein aMBF1 (putative translation factor)
LLSAVLGFELRTLFRSSSLKPSANNKPRHTILAEARNELGVSINKMADDIGYGESFVRQLENDDQTLETYPFDVLKTVADYLKLDPADLLYVAHE